MTATCPCCGDAGIPHLSECRDRICGVAGDWQYFRCAGCRSWWQHPRPSAGESGRFYPEEYPFTRAAASPQRFDDNSSRARMKRALLTAGYGYEFEGVSARWRRGIHALADLRRFFGPFFTRAGFTVRFLSARARGRLLDVGCGNGSFLLTMRGLGWQVMGLEPDRLAAQIARNQGLPVDVATLETATLEDEAFDAVTLSHVIEHVPDPAQALARVARALKPGGLVVSLSPNPNGLLARAYGNTWFQLDCPRHLVLPSERAMRMLAERAGLHATTFTSMRLFRWSWQYSHSIRTTGEASGSSQRGWRIQAGALVSWLLEFIPGRGEEIICIATKGPDGPGARQ